MNIIGCLIKGNFLGGWHFGGTLPMQDIPIKGKEC